MVDILKDLEGIDTAALWAAVGTLTRAMYTAGKPSTDNRIFMALYGRYKAVLGEIDRRMDEEYTRG